MAKMIESRFFFFFGLFITGIFVLFYANGTDNLNYAVEPETIENFELKIWNRSKSIGFLRKSKATNKGLFLQNQIAVNAAALRWMGHLVRSSNVYQKEKITNT
jgi:hypothetical protein